MRRITLEAADQIHKVFRAYRPHSGLAWWFRGQADASWPLLPQAGRSSFFLPDNRDLRRFDYWMRNAVAHVDLLPPNIWECFAMAQHFGLATRLLDWSTNPLVATYFACNDFLECDGAVYLFSPEWFVDKEGLSLEEAGTGVGFIPRAITPRLLNQRAVFTLHNPPNSENSIEPHSRHKDHDNQVQVLIPKDMKAELLLVLDDYGINRTTLFPGLDGWSSHVNWETQGIVK